jgi:hypothetical protein
MSDRRQPFRSLPSPVALTASDRPGPTFGHPSSPSRPVDAPHHATFRAAVGASTRVRPDVPSVDGATILYLDIRRPVEPPDEPVA